MLWWRSVRIFQYCLCDLGFWLYIYIYIYIWMCVFTNPSTWAGYDTDQSYKQSFIGLNAEFFFFYCDIKIKEPSQSYYLPKDRGRIIGFISFVMVLALCEMQTDLSRIWTQVTMSISYNNSHDTTRALNIISNRSYLTHRWDPNTYCHTHIYISTNQDHPVLCIYFMYICIFI